jgi:hypothetical protein
MSRTYPLPNPTATVAKILAEGGPAIDSNQSTGSVETHGVKLAWTVANGQITVTVASKPWIIPMAQIIGELDKFFAVSAGTEAV